MVVKFSGVALGVDDCHGDPEILVALPLMVGALPCSHLKRHQNSMSLPGHVKWFKVQSGGSRHESDKSSPTEWF